MDSADRPVILRGFYLLYFSRFKPQINKIITNVEKKIKSKFLTKMSFSRQQRQCISGPRFSFMFGKKFAKPVNILYAIRFRKINKKNLKTLSPLTIKAE